MEFDRNRSAGILASEIARLYAAALQGALHPLGLSRAQYLALSELWLEDGLTQRLLAERVGVEQATMANTLVRMERDGLIERKPNPDDGRSQQIWLTQAAHRLQAPATNAAAKANELVAEGLPVAERELFFSMLARVIANLRTIRSS
ncbi:MarR family winged helix-turn-helix transcriptional regulator [Hoeflea alexandrii]|uniref:MarR family winged helix-turn-helix transcriptional regulator n=1 Tax=Hoeflea alexandrii TaxID=288436 RepID=UPI0022AE9999|nr:MarR family transcriptional regulator [Hoeflea alexandrii]MCZ4287465.1 MarR family transcriptional regulator [Hoeflea alexandrii]